MRLDLFSKLPALLALAAGLTAAAAESPWTVSFAPEAVASRLDPEAKSVIVVSAGAASSGAREASAAFAAGLRASGKLELVMTDEGMGDVSALDDAAIVKKASGLPIDQVAVVRVFPGAAQDPATAVVTFYGKDGATRGAMTAKAGRGPGGGAAPESVQGVAAGVDQKAAAAVAELNRSRPDAEAEYERKFVSLNDYVAVNQYGTVVNSGSFAYQGKFKRKLEWDEFYDVVGNAEEAGKVRGIRYSNLALSVVGYGLALGALIPYFAVKCDDLAGLQDECTRTRYGLTFGMFGVGGVLVLIPRFRPQVTEPVDKIREQADSYNRKLRSDLGLAPLASGTPRPAASGAVTLSFAPVLAPGFTGGVVDARF